MGLLGWFEARIDGAPRPADSPREKPEKAPRISSAALLSLLSRAFFLAPIAAAFAAACWLALIYMAAAALGIRITLADYL